MPTDVTLIVALAAVLVGLALTVTSAWRDGRLDEGRQRREDRPPQPLPDTRTPRWLVSIGDVAGPYDLPTFWQVSGATRVIDELSDLLQSVFEHPGILRRRDSAARVVLLEGARGAGKTLLVSAAAGSFSVPLIRVPVRRLLASVDIPPQVLIQGIVRLAVLESPSILLIEDIHQLLDGRMPQAPAVAFDLLTALRNIDRSTSCAVICTTAIRARDLHGAGRLRATFDQVLSLELPGPSTRAELLERAAAREDVWMEDIDELLDLTAGMTPAEVLDVGARAAARAVLNKGPDARLDASVLRAVLRDEQAPRVIDDLVLDRRVRREAEALTNYLLDPTANIGLLVTGDRGAGRATFGRCLARTVSRRIVELVEPRADVRDVVEAVDRAVTLSPSMMLVDGDRVLGPQMTQAELDAASAAIERAVASTGVCVVVVAERTDAVHHALRVPNRLTAELRLSRPDHAARMALLRRHLWTVQLRGVTVEDLADELVGLTTRQIVEFARRVLRRAEQRGKHRRLAAHQPVLEAIDCWMALHEVHDIAA